MNSIDFYVISLYNINVADFYVISLYNINVANYFHIYYTTLFYKKKG